MGLLLALLIALVPAWASALPISDKSYFDTRAHTLITFEVDGSGNAVTVPSGNRLLLPADEYAAQGVTFNHDIRWVHDGSPSVIANLAANASAPLGIPSSEFKEFDLLFDVPVHSFGFWVLYFPPGPRPSFTAYDANEAVLGSVVLDDLVPGLDTEGDVDGITSHFMGLVFGTPIARVSFSKEAALLDDLRFSAEVPEPASGLLLACALIAMTATGRRRRRRPAGTERTSLRGLRQSPSWSCRRYP